MTATVTPTGPGTLTRTDWRPRQSLARCQLLRADGPGGPPGPPTGPPGDSVRVRPGPIIRGAGGSGELELPSQVQCSERPRRFTCGCHGHRHGDAGVTVSLSGWHTSITVIAGNAGAALGRRAQALSMGSGPGDHAGPGPGAAPAALARAAGDRHGVKSLTQSHSVTLRRPGNIMMTRRPAGNLKGSDS